ncbi:unnamed protein product [marine sediment metagenome]|uniref:Uncharacterized protein n=1 Tax=marine sediment metagenome TaxID=412755 RepID=X0T0K6_9ZZZZ
MFKIRNLMKGSLPWRPLGSGKLRRVGHCRPLYLMSTGID